MPLFVLSRFFPGLANRGFVPFGEEDLAELLTEAREQRNALVAAFKNFGIRAEAMTSSESASAPTRSANGRTASAPKVSTPPIANGTRKPSLEALEAIINAFRENGLETTLEDLVKVKM